MIRHILLLLLLLAPMGGVLGAQETASRALSLDECKQLARSNYPAISQYDLIAQTRDYTMENAARSWLPQISASLNGLAVTDIMESNPALSQMGFDASNTIAAGSIMVRQVLYDGGQIGANRKMAAAQAEVERNQLDVNLYELNQRIEQLYFGILTLDAQIDLTRNLLEDLELSNQSVASMIKGGIANPSDQDVVKVSQLKCEQVLESQLASRRAFLQMLGTFTGQPLGEDTQLLTPAETPAEGSTGRPERPELAFFDAQTKLVDTREKALNTQLLPTVSLFGVGLYHTQVSDMVKNGTLAGGLSMRWNIGALYTRRGDLRKLDLQRKQIESQRNTFLFNNNLQTQNTQGNIQTLRSQLAKDEEIIALRERIRAASEKKVQLGTESINELLRNINSVNEARQQYALHQIQLVKEIYSCKTNQGY